MIRRQAGILVLLLAFIAASASADSAGVVVVMQGTVEYEYLGETGEVNPGMEIAAGTVFLGCLGDRVEVATRDGLQVIGAFPYTLNAPVLTETELAGYLNVIGGSAVRTRGTAAGVDGVIGWPPNLLDEAMILRGFTLRLDTQRAEGSRVTGDSMTIPVPDPESVRGVEYRALSAPYSRKAAAMTEWTLLGDGNLEKDGMDWIWDFPEYKTDTSTGGRWMNRVEFTVEYDDGTSEDLLFEYRVPESNLTSWVRAGAESAGETAATDFSGEMLKAAELWNRGYTLEAMIIMEAIGLKADHNGIPEETTE